MEAVLHVLRNRYRAGWADWLDLLKDKMTEGALYYANLKEAGPEFIETISTKHEEHPRCAVVGPVYFFR